MTDSDRHFSLLWYAINRDRKKYYTGPGANFVKDFFVICTTIGVNVLDFEWRKEYYAYENYSIWHRGQCYKTHDIIK